MKERNKQNKPNKYESVPLAHGSPVGWDKVTERRGELCHELPWRKPVRLKLNDIVTAYDQCHRKSLSLRQHTVLLHNVIRRRI